MVWSSTASRCSTGEVGCESPTKGGENLVSHLLTALLKRSFRPFEFVSGRSRDEDKPGSGLGLYVHIPFCTTLCDFCPYYKEKYRAELMPRFADALRQEIKTAGDRYGRLPVVSVYYGGGSPFLAIDELPAIQESVHEAFDVRGPTGIELNPDDVTSDTPDRLAAAGFNMASIGIQSFHTGMLASLGRPRRDRADAVATMHDAGFSVVDVDLIFGLPNQTNADIRSDFLRAAGAGATQISTYPFIDFSYSANRVRPRSRGGKRRLLSALLEAADQAGFERTSIWTFARKGTARYSSVTRDSYIGFGPSAASLLESSFSVNVFSVTEYVNVITRGDSPTALMARLAPRDRALLWLFWNTYNLKLDRSAFRTQFGTPIERLFGPELSVARFFGLLERAGDTYLLTRGGAYLFHLLEQLYTKQYIDKVWRASMLSPWPDRLVIQ